MQRFIKRRIAGLTVALTAVVVAAAGCAADSAGSDGDATIGVSMLNMRDPDLAVMADAIEKEAEEMGVDVILVDAKGDVSTELSQIEDLITRQVDAILMMPIDGESSQTAAKLANAEDIPL